MLNIFHTKTDEDLELAKDLFIEYADSLGFDLGFQNFDDELGNLPGCYAPPKGSLLLAKYKGKAVGCVGLRELGNRVCEMKRLYVKPEFRGLGICRAIIAEAVTAEAQKIGYTRMRLDTIPSMGTARELYVSLGFKEISHYRHNPIEGAVFMELKLVTQ